jgi:hypothetical protein
MLDKIKKNDEIPSLLNFLNAKYFCEIGVLRGKNLYKFALNKKVLCFGIDSWEDDRQNGTNDSDYNFNDCYMIAKKVQESNNNIILIKQKSDIANLYFPDGFFDLVYIDANHTYDFVKKDINLWWEKVREGGILSGHDYLDFTLKDVRFGVKEAVNEFVKEKKLDLYVTEDSFPSWMVIKPVKSNKY